MPCLLALAGIVLFPAEGLSASSTWMGPELFVDAPVHHFGVARQQERLEHSFLMQNRGQTDLIIEDVRSTCDCTVGDIRKRRVPPGWAVPLKVVLETRRYQGSLKRAIELQTNDPKSPVVQLEVKARVCTDFAIEPRSIVLQRIAGKSAFEGALRLIQCSDQPLSLAGVDASDSWLTSSLEAVSGEDGGGYVIRVRAREALPVSGSAAILSVHIEQGRAAVVDVPVILPARPTATYPVNGE